MSFPKLTADLTALSIAAGKAAVGMRELGSAGAKASEEMQKVDEATKKTGPSMEELFKQMQQLQIFAGTMSSSFTGPLLESFKKGEISSGEFRKQLEILLLKLKEIRALGNVGKQGYGNLDQDKGDIEKILGEMDKNMGGRRP